MGADADLVVIDNDRRWTITNDADLSKCGWTPYDGHELSVAVETTVLRGHEIYAGGTVTVEPGFGQMATAAAPAVVGN